MEDNTQSNQYQTASMNRTKAPQKVEVVVANSSSGLFSKIFLNKSMLKY